MRRFEFIDDHRKSYGVATYHPMICDYVRDRGLMYVVVDECNFILEAKNDTQSVNGLKAFR
jgi:hypothetical protein